MSVNQQLSSMLNREIIYFNEVEQLIKLGAEPNTCNQYGETYLHYVCRNHGYDQIIEALNLGINPEVFNNLGESALSLYLSRRPIEHRIVEALVKKGANPNTYCQGDNYLHLAISNKMPAEIILAAINLGIDVTLKNHDGFNAPQLYKHLAGKNQTIQRALLKSFNARTHNEFNYDTIINQPDAGAFVCDLLTVNFLPMDLITKLAKTETMKERVYKYITQLTLPTQKAIVDKALDGASPLFQFFSVPRGLSPTSTTSGTFAKLIKLQFDLKKKHIAAKEQCIDLSTEDSLTAGYVNPVQQFTPDVRPPMYNPMYTPPSFNTVDLSQANQIYSSYGATQTIPTAPYSDPDFSQRYYSPIEPLQAPSGTMSGFYQPPVQQVELYGSSIHSGQEVKPNPYSFYQPSDQQKAPSSGVASTTPVAPMMEYNSNR